MQAQGVLHIRRNQYDRSRVAFRHFCDFGGTSRASEFAQLTLIARFGGQ